MTKTITLIVSWSIDPNLVNVAWIKSGNITQRWNQSKKEARNILYKLQEDNEGYELYLSAASDQSAWDYIGE